jgi:hydrogenase maturation protein HypF
VLGGGCFQNDRLSRAVRARLREGGFDVHRPRLFPPNDGAIALGQLAVARAGAPG